MPRAMPRGGHFRIFGYMPGTRPRLSLKALNDDPSHSRRSTAGRDLALEDDHHVIARH